MALNKSEDEMTFNLFNIDVTEIEEMGQRNVCFDVRLTEYSVIQRKMMDKLC